MTSNDIHDQAVENMVTNPQQTVQTWFYNGAWHTQQDYEDYMNSKEMSLLRIANALERIATVLESKNEKKKETKK